MLGSKLSEFHTGYRAFSRNVLESLPLLANSDDFVFDNQMLAQLVRFGYEIAEITCPAKYFNDASSTNVWRSMEYGFGVLWTTAQYLFHRCGGNCRLFDPEGRKITGGISEPPLPHTHPAS